MPAVRGKHPRPLSPQAGRGGKLFARDPRAMFETLFANPAALTVGGAMISSPILIHLINRMRFKRLRWAAMEFLLKSQKRNRRRLIIEQLLLLLLRCLLIALAALLLSRFIGCTGAWG